jgi:hypothetical protein
MPHQDDGMTPADMPEPSSGFPWPESDLTYTVFTGHVSLSHPGADQEWYGWQTWWLVEEYDAQTGRILDLHLISGKQGGGR